MRYPGLPDLDTIVIGTKGIGDGCYELEFAMPPAKSLTKASLKTPKAAAIAGIVFSVLLLVFFWLIRSAVPADPLGSGAWLATSGRRVAFGLNLVPVAGIAFLWFIGVIRDRLGQLEDRFFATVFFGSGLLFLAMLFIAAAAIGAIVLLASSEANELMNSATFHFARAFAYLVMNVYAIKAAAVFMISTSTVALYTSFLSRWLAYLGYILACSLLFGSYYIGWSFMVLPVWVLMISSYIIVDNSRRPSTV